MRQQRHFVGLADDVARAERPIRIAAFLGNRTVTRAGLAQPIPDHVRRNLAVGSIIPGDGHRLEPGPRRPRMVADHGHQIVEDDDLTDARDRHGRGIVDTDHLAAEHGTRGEGGELHPRRQRVDAVLRRAVRLVRRVQPLQRLADQAEVLGVLQRRIRRRQCRGTAGQGGVGQLAARRRRE